MNLTVGLLTSSHSKEQKSAGSEVTKAIINGLESNGLIVHHLEVSTKQSRLFSILPWFLRTTLETLCPPVSPPSNIPLGIPIIAFESEGVSAALQIANDHDCFMIIPDLPADRVRYTLKANLANIRFLKTMITKGVEMLLLKQYIARKAPKAQFAVYGAQHKRELEKRFSKPVIDLRPQLDIVPSFRRVEINRLDDTSLRLVFGGSLTGTASKLARVELLRVLSYKPDLSLKVIGKGSRKFIKQLALCSTRKKFVENPANFEEELAKSDLFLMLGDYPVGVRTRVLSALAAGNIIVAHEAIYAGMPELRGCATLFSYNSTSELPKIFDIISAGDLNEKRQRSVEFWRKHYSLERTMEPIFTWLQQQ